MNRRNFFRLLTGAVAAPVLAPLAKLLPTTTTYVQAYIQGKEALSTYYDKNFLKNVREQTEMSALCSQVSYNVRYTVGLPPASVKRIRFVTYPLDKSKEV